MRLRRMHSLTACIFFITFHGETVFLILSILSIPVKIQICVFVPLREKFFLF
jgi:hypothetical protein